MPLTLQTVDFYDIKPWWHEQYLFHDRIKRCLREQNDNKPVSYELLGQVIEIMTELKVNDIEVREKEEVYG